MAYVTGLFVVDAPASALNNAGPDTGAQNRQYDSGQEDSGLQAEIGPMYPRRRFATGSE